MAKGQKQYTDEFRNTIVELYNAGKSVTELSGEYALSKSTISGWIKKNKPIAVKKSYGHIRKEITTVFEFITNNKKEHDIKLMCKVLKIPRSSYYKYLNKKPSNRELENIKIEKEITNIYKDSKKRYGAVKINKSLKAKGINISLKKTQR